MKHLYGFGSVVNNLPEALNYYSMHQDLVHLLNITCKSTRDNFLENVIKIGCILSTIVRLIQICTDVSDNHECF